MCARRVLQVGGWGSCAHLTCCESKYVITSAEKRHIKLVVVRLAAVAPQTLLQPSSSTGAHTMENIPCYVVQISQHAGLEDLLACRPQPISTSSAVLRRRPAFRFLARSAPELAHPARCSTWTSRSLANTNNHVTKSEVAPHPAFLSHGHLLKSRYHPPLLCL